MTISAAGRARLAYAVTCRELSDQARDLAARVDVPTGPGERVRAAMVPRRIVIHAIDQAVIIEALDGTSWDDLADALMLPTQTVIDRYAGAVRYWSDLIDAELVDPTIYGDYTTGLLHDNDPEGTAQSVDAWLARHAEPWDAGSDGPVLRALTV